MYDIFVLGNNPNWKKIKSKYPFAKKVETFTEAKTKSLTSMFWTVWDDIEVNEDFDFTLSVPKWDEEYVHVWKNGEYFDGISLVPKNKDLNEKEIKYRFFVDKKEIDDVASVPKPYDIFEIETYEQYLDAMEKSSTEMFWMTTPNVKIADDFNFNIQCTRYENHAFVHLVNGEKLYNGIFLLSKNKPVSKKEIEHRYIVERKEWDIIASGPCQYDKFIVDTYEQYQYALANSKTEMFYMIPSDVIVLDDFKFDIYYSHDKEFERKTHHALLNSVLYDGIFLVSKYAEISQKEIENKFIIDRKEEEDILASNPIKFDKFEIATYQDYLEACNVSSTNMFWAVWPDVDVVEDFDFEYYVPRYNQHITHVFKNDKYFDGICLFNKTHKVNEREFKYRFFNEKKEVDYVISYPKQYDKFTVDTYEEYIVAKSKSKTDLFWLIPNGLKILDNFKLDLYYTHHDTYNRTVNHVFRNGEFYDGIMLTPKEQEISKKEFDSWFVINRKEHDELASMPTSFDKFDIATYDDYLTAVEKSTTGMFWAIWSDVNVVEDFEFDYYVPRYNQHITHVFKNDGYFDGICLFSKHNQISQREFKYRYFNEKKEVDYVISYPKPYNRFIVDTYEQYLEAKSQTTTDMFYMIPSDVIVSDDFNFNIQCTRYENHALLNGDYYDGIFLVSKYAEISQKEIDNKFILERKEEEILASRPVKFDVCYINSYEDYISACENSTTNMFWAVWSDVEVVEEFDFDYYVPRYSQHITHIFKNGEYFDGICLFSKHNKVGEKEFKYRFFNEKKEIDYVISYPKKFDIFEIETYDQYLNAMENSSTEMFWMSTPNVKIVDDFNFDLYITHHNVYERQENHAFVHLVDNAPYYSGIFLLSKNKPVSAKEIEHRYIVDRKEWDIVASGPCQYDIFEIETYEQYLEAMSKSKTEMFWMTTPNVKTADDFKFDTYFTHEETYDRKENHAYAHLVNGEKLYNGIFLLSKHKPVTAKEIEHRYIVDRKEYDTVASGPCQYDKFIVDTYEQYQYALANSKTEMFYMIPSGVRVVDNFNFDFYFNHNNQYDRNIIHSFQNSDFYDGIMLVPKSVIISENEFNYGHIINRKEYEILASMPNKFDQFKIATYDDYLSAMTNSTTSMFWAIWPDVEVVDDFEYDYYVPKYEQHIPHVFKNGEYFDGICLFSKHSTVSEKEFKYRFFNEKKEVDYIASYPKQYDIFEIETYEQYLDAMSKSSTDMFWMTTPNVKIVDDFKFDVQCSRFENHAFVHLVNGEKLYNGIFLLSKHKTVTSKEIEHRYIVDRKEWDIVASGPCKYDKFVVETYEQYLEAMANSKTEMFWAVTNNIKINDHFEFDLYFSHDRIYDRKENHTFIHLVDEQKLFNGVFLLSKHKPISEKEIVHRYIIDRKEWDIIASGPCKYDMFTITNYTQYLEAMANSKTEMFWMIPSEVEPLDTFNFDTYFTHNDVYNRNMNHSFKHLFRGEENYNGINLMSKYVPITEKEITFRYIVEKKEWDITASKVKPYDIVFISYNESNADENFDRVKTLYPRVKRVHGVKGIHQAHIKAAEQADTDNFWVVDGDAVVVDDFKFDYEIPVWEYDTVHVWRSQNPVNNLVYGYGGVKLLPRQLTLDMDVTRPDMTTSISTQFKPVQVVSNITAFNTDEFSTWKSAFRECAKLAGKTIDRQVDTETEERLTVWCTEGADKPFGEYAIKGALAGRKFATENPDNLFKINDFDWLYEQFLNEKNNSK